MTAAAFKEPAPAYQGWDIEFTKLASAVGTRVVQLLRVLAQECIDRGYRAQISHGLQDADVSSALLVVDQEFKPVAKVLFVLSNGWELCQVRGARLDGQVFPGEGENPLFVPLARFSEKLSADADEVFFGAGDWVDAAELQRALALVL